MVGDRGTAAPSRSRRSIFSMVIRKVYCTVSAPHSEKNSRLKASLRFCRTRENFVAVHKGEHQENQASEQQTRHGQKRR